MNFRRVALLTLALGAALTACDNNHDQISNTAIEVNRFQAVVNSSDTLMLDAATGDLWRLDEAPGNEGAHWVRYANAPTDVKSIDPDQVLHPPGPPEAGGEEQPAEDDQQDKGDDDNGDGNG